MVSINPKFAGGISKLNAKKVEIIPKKEEEVVNTNVSAQDVKEKEKLVPDKDTILANNGIKIDNRKNPSAVSDRDPDIYSVDNGDGTYTYYKDLNGEQHFVGRGDMPYGERKERFTYTRTTNFDIQSPAGGLMGGRGLDTSYGNSNTGNTSQTTNNRPNRYNDGSGNVANTLT